MAIPVNNHFRYLFVLNEIKARGGSLDVTLPVEWQWIDKIIGNLFIVDEYLDIPNFCEYKLAEKAVHQLTEALLEKSKLIKTSEVFAFVDVKAGEFAFSKYYDLSPEQWEVYKNESRWTDLRLTVAHFERANLDKLLFYIHFFDSKPTSIPDWQMWLANGGLELEIYEFKQNFISWENLGGLDVIKEIIRQGNKLTLTLI